MLDNEFVRSQFPAFSVPELQGQAFFENAGGSYCCRQVIERLNRFYTARKLQPYYPHPASRVGGEEMDEARARLSAYLGIDNDELSFGPSTTQNTYVLAQAFREYLSPGDVIIVTDQDHEANSGPWRRLAQKGIELREWRVDPDTGSLNPRDLSNLLDEKVRLVCFSHCSNVVAEVNPVRQITDMIHAAGALACVDGVSYAPHGLPDVGALGADIYLFSSYKTFGPHQGIMVIRRDLARQLPNQAHYFNADVLYKRFTPAGPDHAQIAACAGMIDYFETLCAHHAPDKLTGTRLGVAVNGLIHAYEKTLLERLMGYLEQKPGIQVLGPPGVENRAPFVSIVTKDSASQVATRLAEENVIAGCGSFYAVRLMEAMGLDTAHGAVRLSFTHYTSMGEIEQLIDALERVLSD